MQQTKSESAVHLGVIKAADKKNQENDDVDERENVEETGTNVEMRETDDCQKIEVEEREEQKEEQDDDHDIEKLVAQNTEKDAVLLDGMLEDVLKMKSIDPNKIHQVGTKDVDKIVNNDDSDDIYESSNENEVDISIDLSFSDEDEGDGDNEQSENNEKDKAEEQSSNDVNEDIPLL